MTDPPYFLDKLDDGWQDGVVENKRNQYAVKSLPAGMKFSPEQGFRFYEWYLDVSMKLLRVIKPGGFFFSFSSPRLYHRMACAVEDAGFFVRDQFIWLYTQNQPKAMGLDHFIRRLQLADEEKTKLSSELRNWKTPQVKSCHEPIVMAQKPPEGTFLDNYRSHGVGLIDTSVKVGDNMFVANVLCDHIDENIDKYFLVSKPNRKEKGDFNTHKTVKPVSLCRLLICLCTRSKQVVLDPFMGSGTTCVAAKLTGRNYIGIDKEPKYIEIAEKRINNAVPEE